MCPAAIGHKPPARSCLPSHPPSHHGIPDSPRSTAGELPSRSPLLPSPHSQTASRSVLRPNRRSLPLQLRPPPLRPAPSRSQPPLLPSLLHGRFRPRPQPPSVSGCLSCELPFPPHPVSGVPPYLLSHGGWTAPAPVCLHHGFDPPDSVSASGAESHPELFVGRCQLESTCRPGRAASADALQPCHPESASQLRRFTTPA